MASHSEQTKSKPTAEDWALSGMITVLVAASTLVLPWWSLVVAGVSAIGRGVWQMWRETTGRR